MYNKIDILYICIIIKYYIMKVNVHVKPHKLLIKLDTWRVVERTLNGKHNPQCFQLRRCAHDLPNDLPTHWQIYGVGSFDIPFIALYKSYIQDIICSTAYIIRCVYIYIGCYTLKYAFVTILISQYRPSLPLRLPNPALPWNRSRTRCFSYELGGLLSPSIVQIMKATTTGS